MLRNAVHDVVLGSPFLNLTENTTRHVDAMPDPGAHVSVMSASFAQEHGFVINTAEIYQKDLEFADISMATTMGKAETVEWGFESSRDSHRLDVYVLEVLQTDLILDNTFLLDTDAFAVHEDDFWKDDDQSSDDYWSISIIMLVVKALKGSRWGTSGKERCPMQKT